MQEGGIGSENGKCEVEVRKWKQEARKWKREVGSENVLS
jgi:hypothetical protein